MTNQSFPDDERRVDAEGIDPDITTTDTDPEEDDDEDNDESLTSE